MTSRKGSVSKVQVVAEQKQLADFWNPPKRQRTAAMTSSASSCSKYESLPLCPICNSSMWKDDALNNLHIDACLQRIEKMSAAAIPESSLHDDPHVYSLKYHTVTELPGLIVIPNFITEEEETELIKCLDDDSLMSWKISSFNGNCFSKYFGVKTQFGLPNELRLVRSNETQNGEHDMPQELHPFVLRLQRFVGLHAHHLPNELRDFKPNECNINSYFPAQGHYLRPHFDDRTLSGPVLMNLSLCGAARMTFAKPTNANLPTSAIATGTFTHYVPIQLPRRCLQLVTGVARWSYTHEIKHEDLLTPRRMSITWRQCGGKKGILSSEAKAGNDVSALLRKQEQRPAENTSERSDTCTPELMK